MHNYISDPTANAAIGAVDRELREKRREAEKLAALRRSGQLSYEEELRARARFTGIFRHILDEALNVR